MAVIKGDYQSVMTAGWWITDTSGSAAPSAPSITALVDNANGTATVTIDGAAGVTNYVYYGGSGVALTLGGSRSGDGTVVVTPAAANAMYHFLAVSKSGDYYSLPSAMHALYVTDGSAVALTSWGAELTAAAIDQMDQYGEQITYSPLGGVARLIQAIVDREGLQALGGGEHALRPALTIEVLNRATSITADGYGGIATEEVNTGGDTVTVSRRIDEAPRVMRIAQIVGQDEAMLTLEVR